ncbi:MAG: DedA family protein [Candidatus Marsarchaeota archaeon]|nr:DedA family protein [Candidatus Marsarchaeota archaeon]
MFLESASLPVPSELVLPLTGYLIFAGKFQFFPSLASATLGSLGGSMVDYMIGAYVGKEAAMGSKVFRSLSGNRLIEAERWFSRYGYAAVFLARLVPLVRTFIAFPAGFGRMRVFRFTGYSFAGIVLWNTVLIYVGVVAGENFAKVAGTLYSDFTLAEAAVLVVLTVLLSYHLVKRKHR